MEALTFTKNGAKSAAPVKLNAHIFGQLPTNYELLKLAYNAYLANGRTVLAATKNRGEVNGGGKKPWRQKGTGRSRVGSSRVPHWRGGGVAFGPTGIENFRLSLPVKAKRQALRQALSLAAADKKIRIIESLESKDGKVKHFAGLLHKMDAAGNVLLITGQKDDLVTRAAHNVPGIKIISAMYVSVFDVLNADAVILDTKALAELDGWLRIAPKPAAAKGKTA